MSETGSLRFGSVFVFGLLAASFASASLSPEDIMRKNEEMGRVTDSSAESVLVTASGGTEHRKGFTMKRKLDSDGKHYFTLTRFSEPAEIRGEGILFLEHATAENEVMLYLPAYRKIRRVESQQQSGSFMGSAFSYSDITTQHPEDYKFKLLREEACGSVQCWVIEATPATDAIHTRTGYTRSVSWVRQDNTMQVKIDSYDGDTLLKEVVASHITEVDPAQHRWMALHLEMKNLKTGASTVLDFSHVAVDVPGGLPASVFTQTSLAQEK